MHIQGINITAVLPWVRDIRETLTVHAEAGTNGQQDNETRLYLSIAGVYVGRIVVFGCAGHETCEIYTSAQWLELENAPIAESLFEYEDLQDAVKGLLYHGWLYV